MLLECDKWYALGLPIDALPFKVGTQLLGVGGSKHLALWYDGDLWDMTNVGVTYEHYPMSWVDYSEVLGTVNVTDHPAGYLDDPHYEVTTLGLLHAAKREGSWLPIHGWSYRYCCYDILTLVTGGKLYPRRTWDSTIISTCTPL